MLLLKTLRFMFVVLVFIHQNISWSYEFKSIQFFLHGHEGTVTQASFSPDSKRIVTASEDKTVKVWDASNGDLIFTITSSTKPFNKVCFDKTGNRLITSKDESVGIWNAHNGEWIEQGKKDQSCLNNIVSLDGQKKLSISSNRRVCVTDAETGEISFSISNPLKVISRANFGDSNEIFTIATDGSVDLWSAKDGSYIEEFIPKQQGIISFSFSPDKNSIVTVSKKSSILVRKILPEEFRKEHPYDNADPRGEYIKWMKQFMVTSTEKNHTNFLLFLTESLGHTRAQNLQRSAFRKFSLHAQDCIRFWIPREPQES